MRIVPVLMAALFLGGCDEQPKADAAPGDYTPNVAVTYWTFRIMVGTGLLAALIGFAGLWLMWSKKLESARWFLRLAVPAIAIPYIGNISGWVFTEMGRQPWVVYGLQLTRDGVSPTVSAWTVGISLAGFVALYGVLGVVDFILLRRYAKAGPTDESTPDDVGAALAY